MNSIGVAVPPPISGRRKPSVCQAPGCEELTRHRKPYCLDHIDTSPYVQGILEQLEQREVEIKRAQRYGLRAVVVDGHVAQEIQAYLVNHGSTTQSRMARELRLPARTIAAYLSALSRLGAIQLEPMNRRNRVRVDLAA